jgi:Zn finger protein HypA/HybF involved in hydrogenase expression
LPDPSGVVAATGKCPHCLKHVVKLDRGPEALEDSFSIAQLQQVRRNQLRLMLLVAIPPTAGMLAFALFGIAAGYLWPQLTPGESGKTALLILICAGPVLGIALYAWRTLVRCPACRYTIGAMATLITAGRCPHCSAAIVRDAVPPTEYRPLPKLAEVETATRTLAVQNLLWMFAYLMVGLIGFGMLGAAARSVPDTPWGNVSRVVLYFAGTAVGLLPCWFLFSAYRRRTFPNKLLCQNCREPITTSHTLLRCTGNCPHCGQRAVKDA